MMSESGPFVVKRSPPRRFGRGLGSLSPADWGLTLAFISMLVGCDQTVPRYRANALYTLVSSTVRQAEADRERASLVADDAADVAERFFGTPADPKWPATTESGRGGEPPLVSVANLRRCAGSVASDRDDRHRGLFREHCVTCHGISGDGRGPAATFQDPHPRNFRPGIFKWKSTVRNAKPTRADLRRTLVAGLPGSPMPSFAALQQRDPSELGSSSVSDLDALVDYVIYLSARGEFERRLIDAAWGELGYDEESVSAIDRLNDPNNGIVAEVIAEALQSVLASWRQADQKPVEVPATFNRQVESASVENGRRIFHGAVANCAGCHGVDGRGGNPPLDFDDWGKEYSTRIGIPPQDREAMRPIRRLGGLKPRTIDPRILHGGVARGGDDADTLFCRVTQGIAGTPMPAIRVDQEGSGTSLSIAEAADLIAYVRSLLRPVEESF